MSPRYGLNAARGAIEAPASEGRGLRTPWGVAPPRILHYAANDEVLVDTAPGQAARAEVPHHPRACVH
jgi:hypothetical protein